MGEQGKKLLNDVFFEAKSTKQGVGEARLASDNQRLCDSTGEAA